RETTFVPGVDELLGRRRHRGEDAEPGERVVPFVRAEHAVGHGVATYAVESVAPGDHVRVQLPRRARGVDERHHGRVGIDAAHLDVGDLEERRTAGGVPRGDEVLDDVLLTVDPDRATGQVGQRDPVATAVESELDAVVRYAFDVQAFADAELAEKVDGALFEHSRADPLSHVLSTVLLDHDGLDAVTHQQV